jgi:hypothetical protein
MASRLKPRRSLLVVLDVLEVLAPIHLDDQVSLDTNEIDDVGTHRDLPTKVVPSELVAAEPHPEIDLRIGHPPAEFAPSLKFGP